MNENLKLRLCDLECMGDNSLKMRIFCVQNVKSSFAVMGLVNEVANIPWNYTEFFCSKMPFQVQTSKLRITVPDSVL